MRNATRSFAQLVIMVDSLRRWTGSTATTIHAAPALDLLTFQETETSMPRSTSLVAKFFGASCSFSVITLGAALITNSAAQSAKQDPLGNDIAIKAFKEGRRGAAA
jgi:hypothetical protein